MDLELLKSKFRGTMLGGLIGNIIGKPYQGRKILSISVEMHIERLLNRMMEYTNRKGYVMKFSVDSLLTRSVAESLIEKRDLDIVDIAKRFVECFYQEPSRGYKFGHIQIFTRLKELWNKTTESEIDVKGPAKDIFGGSGSYGNGGAVRIAPVSLFSYNNYDNLLHYVKEATQITHAHELGINGAILQAIAIQQTLYLHPNEELNVSNFIDDLINKMDKIEVDESQPYKDRLKIIKNLLSETGDEPNKQRVVEELGNKITALDSVPTAIFCFLKAQKNIKGIRTNDPIKRAIQYAISLGDDTDTIASMTGALAGAFYGHEKFSEVFLSYCEQTGEFGELADALFDVATSKT